MDIVSRDDFFQSSSKCLVDMLDVTSGITDTNKMYRELDAYRYLHKLQMEAVTSGDAVLQKKFFEELYNRRTALLSPDDGDDDSAKPSDEQIVEFRAHVSKWFQLDSELKDLQKLAKEKRVVKNKLRDVILAFMKRYNIEELRTQNGKLRFETRSVRRAPSKSAIEENMQTLLRDRPELARELQTKLFASDEVQTVSLKRVR
eukprot:jgi/Tetstr1/447217/TSEL_034654.t1